MKKPAPLSEAVEYVALNDEPMEMSASAMEGYASVHVLSVVYRLTTRGAARKVIAYRKKLVSQDAELGDAIKRHTQGGR